MYGDIVMKIQQILDRHYKEFLDMCTNKDTIIYGGLTSEDILQNVCITAIRKFGDEEIEEEDGYKYIKDTLLLECFFSFKRKKKDSNIVFLPDYPKNL